MSELEDVDGNDGNMKLYKVREEIKMTELGIMLINEGKQKGKQEKAIETAKIAIKKCMSDELINELTGLTIEYITIIRKIIKSY